MAHPHSGIFATAAEASAYGAEFVSETNAADFNGLPATGFAVFEVAGHYGPYFEVAFTRELSPAVFA